MSLQPLIKFYFDHLRRRGPIVYQALAGAACEFWAVTEMCACINSASPSILPPDTFLVNEDKKRDVVFWKDLGTDHSVIASLEAKVVYPTGKSLDGPYGLKDQLCRQPLADEIPRMPRFGLILAVWDNWYESRRWPDAECFFDSVVGIMRQVFTHEEYRPACAGMLEVVLPPAPILRGKLNRQTALAAGYLERLPVDLTT
jgi:hypothetical protein